MAVKPYVGILGDSGAYEYIVDPATGKIVMDLSQVCFKTDYDNSWTPLPSGNFVSVNWGLTAFTILTKAGDIVWHYRQKADELEVGIPDMDDSSLRFNIAETAAFALGYTNALGRTALYKWEKDQPSPSAPFVDFAPNGENYRDSCFAVGLHNGVEVIRWLLVEGGVVKLYEAPVTGTSQTPSYVCDIPDTTNVFNCGLAYSHTAGKWLIVSVSNTANTGFYIMPQASSTLTAKKDLSAIMGASADNVDLRLGKAEHDTPMWYGMTDDKLVYYGESYSTNECRCVVVDVAAESATLLFALPFDTYIINNVVVGGYRVRNGSNYSYHVKPVVGGKIVSEARMYHLSDTNAANSVSGTGLILTNSDMSLLEGLVYFSNTDSDDVDGFEPIYFDEHTITGTVTQGGSAVEGARVWLLNNSGHTLQNTYTDASGEYTLYCFDDTARRVMVVLPTGETKLHDAVVPQAT